MNFLASELSVDSAFKSVRENGVAIYHQYFQRDVLSNLNTEFERAFEGKHFGVEPISLKIGRGAIINKNEVSQSEFPQTITTFSDKFMDKLCELYLGSKVETNKQIYFMNEVVGTSHVAMDMHFDVLPTFKFFIYLTDTTRENGAFACVPGSQKISSEIREKMGKEISFEQREVTRQIPFGENEVLHVEGKAGTLIIFTTEVFHRAGKVSKGERRVMRGHNRP